MRDTSGALPSTAELIAVLTGIKHDSSCFTLTLQNFVRGTYDEIPYLVEVQYNDENSKSLARMVVSLICQLFQLQIAGLSSDYVSNTVDIHLKRLCFVKVKGLLTGKGTYYTLQPKDILPVEMAKAIDYALNRRDTSDGKTIYDTFQNLIDMSNDPSNAFQLRKVENYDNSLSSFVAGLIENKKKQEKVNLDKNPIFTAMRSATACEESLNDFNSQVLSETFDTSNSLGLVEETDSSSYAAISQESAHKRAKIGPSQELVDLDSIQNSSPGTEKTFSGKIFGIYPTKAKAEKSLSNIFIYFIPRGWPYDSTLTLIPNVNCIEILVSEDNKLFELFLGVLLGRYGFDEKLMLNDISISIKRQEKELKDGLVTAMWSLVRIEDDNLMKDLKIPKKIQLLKKDPLITLSQLKLDSHGVKFVTMLGLLVSCSFEVPNFVKLVFTDFTNTDIPQKYLLDPYLIDFDNKLHSNEGFRAIIYPEKFEEFNKLIKSEFDGKSIKEMFLQGAETNVSHRGIVCKMSVKVNLYGGKLNAIVRECEPITCRMNKHIDNSDEDEKKHLNQLYRRTLEVIPAHSIKKFLHLYSVCFPFCEGDDDSGDTVIMSPQFGTENNSPVELGHIPSIYVDDLNSYRMEYEADLSLLNQSTDLGVVYPVEGQVISIDYDKTRLELIVTNSLFQQDFIDPTRVARIEILGPENLGYFFNNGKPKIGDDDIDALKAITMGKEIKLRITRGAVPLYNKRGQRSCLMVWCPIELTMQEIKSQLSLYDDTSFKKEGESKDSLVGQSMIKLEN